MTHPATPYDDALDWLYRQTRGGLPRDPERTRRLLARLAIATPPASVHVVGTNGKGTVAAMIAAGYTHAGRRVGRFLSPHVEDFRERIEVSGRPIPRRAVRGFVARARALVAEGRIDPPPSFFEWTFAMALEHFAREGVELAVVEAGVGARNDATIVLDRVRVVVIPSVGLDHLDAIGPTLDDVVDDKAAAIRPGVPVVTAVRGAVLDRIAATASTRNSPLFVDDAANALFRLDAAQPTDPGPGGPRRQNQRLAAAALRLLDDLPEASIAAGLRCPPLPARAERFDVAGREVVLDGAHNPAAAEALLATAPPPFALLFGALPRKAGAATLAVLEPHAVATVVTGVDGGAAGFEARPGRERIDDPEEALARALALTPPGVPLLIAGSLHLAGRLRPLLRARRAPPAPAPSVGRDGPDPDGLG